MNYIFRVVGIVFPFLSVLFSNCASAQNYTSYFTGDTADVSVNTIPGIVLMGGASENDSAMIWFLEQSGGGDVVVLRASGSNGYNNYMYSQLGVVVNSVQTIVFNQAAASFDPYVIRQLANAEALWFAGGDQWDYVSYWKNTPIDSTINYLINTKKIPVGGTSAGMAILGHIVNTAQYGSATSTAALANPYVANLTLLKDDFISCPWLNNVVTDTHYDNPDRRGRHIAFMARAMTDYTMPSVFGIACNEYVSVCIDTNGLARVYGDYPNYQEFAFFLQANCVLPNFPEACSISQPLTWNRNAQAIKVYKVPGTPSGINTFQLSNWNSGSGGTWQDWYVVNGVFQTNLQASTPICNSSTSISTLIANEEMISIFPNPVTNQLTISAESNFDYEIVDVFSKQLLMKKNTGSVQLDVTALRPGYYFVIVKTQESTVRKKIIKIN
ncbi:MAG: T9SS type A sorting domain-containing protein [Bacteroidetes bacterium]|nr:T9SS type A sorting domain-containing protein [Bacteroidota bacterium]